MRNVGSVIRMIQAALAICVGLSFQSSAIVYEDFEDATLVLGDKETCCGHSFVRQQSIVRSGNWAGRFEVHKGDKMVNGGARSEFRRNLSLPDREAWCGWSTYIPSIMTQRSYVRFMQYWSGQSGSSGMVCVGLTPNATIAIECRWGPNNGLPTQQPKYKANAWNDLVLHVVWPRTEGGSGVMQLWINGTKVADYQPKGTSTGLPSTHKFGLYSSEGDFADYTNKIAKVDAWLVDDEIRFVQGKSSYDEVKPRSGATTISSFAAISHAQSSQGPQLRVEPSIIGHQHLDGVTLYSIDGKRVRSVGFDRQQRQGIPGIFITE